MTKQPHPMMFRRRWLTLSWVPNPNSREGRLPERSQTKTSISNWLYSVSLCCYVGLLSLGNGCAKPDSPTPEPPKLENAKDAVKKPAETAYGKALEAADRLKEQANDYNDRLEKLNDPFAK